MMEGVVANGIEAIVELQLIGRRGQTEIVAAVIDTGFTSDLTLPPSAVRELGYKKFATYEITLADGSTVRAQVFEGLIDWFGREKSIKVIQSNSDALLGMGLMQDCRLTMDIVPDGKFTIVPLGTTTGAMTNA